MSRVNQQQYEEALLLLPWYVTGKLGAEERALVEEVLEGSSELQQELTRQTRLSSMISKDPGVLDLTAITTQDQRLEAALNRIKEHERITESKSSSGLIAQIREWFGSLFSMPARNWGYAAGVLFVFLQLAILVVVMKDNGSLSPDSYELASGDEPYSVEVSDQPALMFEFTPQATHDAIHKLFDDIGVVHFEHPDGSSNYKVVLSGTWTESQIDALISNLEKKGELILLVGRSY